VNASGKFALMAMAILLFVAVVGVVLFVASRFSGRKADRGVAAAFLAPTVLALLVGLIYPGLRTIYQSFFDAAGSSFIALGNYQTIFTDSEQLVVLRNTVLWVVITPFVATAVGLLYAILVDKSRFESAAKALIFLPMAISFVGASAIWGLVYDYSASGEQTGLLNAFWSTLGGNPVFWLREDTFRLNSLLLMVILVWLQTGFAMILLSSAIKGVPDDTLEAARIDGATEWQIFWRVVIPQIKGTIITVFITVLILVLKVFDIVYVLTNGQNRTEVIANLFFKELFANSNAGYASAIVVVLLIAVTPVLVYQVRHFRAEEANR